MPRITDAEISRARLEALPFSYREVGSSAGVLPAGYRHLEVERRLGAGAERFEIAVQRLMTWDMHRRAGLLVDLARPTVTTGGVALLSMLFGPVTIAAPVRVVEAVAERRVRGFAYGTLPGHPESGEERFLIHHDPDDTVRATIRAFSRPARWFTRLGGPVARRVQDRTTDSYLAGLAAHR